MDFHTYPFFFVVGEHVHSVVAIDQTKEAATILSLSVLSFNHLVGRDNQCKLSSVPLRGLGSAEAPETLKFA